MQNALTNSRGTYVNISICEELTDGIWRRILGYFIRHTNWIQSLKWSTIYSSNSQSEFSEFLKTYCELLNIKILKIKISKQKFNRILNIDSGHFSTFHNKDLIELTNITISFRKRKTAYVLFVNKR